MYGLIGWASVCFRQIGHLGVDGGARADLCLRYHVENALGELAPLGARGQRVAGSDERQRAKRPQKTGARRGSTVTSSGDHQTPEYPTLLLRLY